MKNNYWSIQEIDKCCNLPVYICIKCNKEVFQDFMFCPYCGVKFQGNISYRPHQYPNIQSNPEIENHLEILSRFATFIVNEDNPKTKMQALWILADEKERKKAAALIDLGVENLLKQMEGYSRYPGFEEYRDAYGVCASEEGGVWMREAFDTLRKLE